MAIPITERALEILNKRSIEKSAVKIRDLDFPLNDKSIGVSNFEDWKYFQSNKIDVGHFQPHSSQWCGSLVQRIKNQRFYKQTREFEVESKGSKDLVAKLNSKTKGGQKISQWIASDGGGSVSTRGTVKGTTNLATNKKP